MSITLLVLHTSVSCLVGIPKKVIMSVARFSHFLQGPHFKFSSCSLQVQSLGFGHLDIPSALPCLDPGRYSTVKSKADKISIQRAIRPLGSRRLKSHLTLLPPRTNNRPTPAKLLKISEMYNQDQHAYIQQSHKLILLIFCNKFKSNHPLPRSVMCCIESRFIAVDNI